MIRLLFACLALGICGAEPISAGLKPGQRPGPYSFLVATGPNRGQSFCFICETGERPAIVVFARSMSVPLAKLAAACDTVLNDAPKDAMMGWMTILGEKTIAPDALAVWSQKAGLKTLATGIFDDAVGPPAYRLSSEADISVVAFVGRKVTFSRAFRIEELTDSAIADIAGKLTELAKRK